MFNNNLLINSCYTGDVDDNSEVVYIGERHVTPVQNNVAPKTVPPLMVKRPRGKQIVFVEASSSEDEGTLDYEINMKYHLNYWWYQSFAHSRLIRRLKCRKSIRHSQQHITSCCLQK